MTSRSPAFASFDSGTTALTTVESLKNPLCEPAAPRTENDRSEFERGYSEGAARKQEELGAMADALCHACADIAEEQKRLIESARDETLRVILKLLRAAAPRLALASAKSEIRAIFEASEANCAPEKIELKGSAEFLRELRENFPDAFSKCSIVENDAIAHGDLIATWPGGELRCMPMTATDAICNALERRLQESCDQEISA
jgi:hypothetical protein